MYDRDVSGLPHSVRAWAELEQRYPTIEGIDITELNDGAAGDEESAAILPHSFAELADLIERYL